WLDMDAANAHCRAGLGPWDWASSPAVAAGDEPDVVLACCGDVPTLETLAAADLLRRHLPSLKVRVVNVVDVMRLQSPSEHPHALSDTDFDAVFNRDKPIVFAWHGYPSLIHQLTYRRTNHGNLHVRGYKEKGTTTTPFDMVMLNDLDRFHLVIDVIDRVPSLGTEAVELRAEMVARRIEAREHTRLRGEDAPVGRDWTWPYCPGATCRGRSRGGGGDHRGARARRPAAAAPAEQRDRATGPAPRPQPPRARLRAPAGDPLVQPPGPGGHRAPRGRDQRLRGVPRQARGPGVAPGRGRPPRRDLGRGVDRLRRRHGRRVRRHRRGRHRRRPPPPRRGGPRRHPARAAPGRHPRAGRRRGLPDRQHLGLREPPRGAVAGGAAVDRPRAPAARAPHGLRRAGQPRLVRRPDRVPAPVRPEPLAGGLAQP